MLSLDQQNTYRERYRASRLDWRPATEVYAAAVRRHVCPGVRMLDLGCGRGGLVEQLEAADREVIGVDPDRRSLAEHRLSTEAMPRAAAWMAQLPFPRCSFDLLIASWVLEHLEHPAAVFAEMARVLRPGGRLVVLTPNRWHPVTLANRLLAWSTRLQGQLISRLYGRAEWDTFAVHYRANSVGCLRHLGTTVGLIPVAIETIPDPTYLAFNDQLFTLSQWLEQLLPAAARVHIVGEFVRR